MTQGEVGATAAARTRRRLGWVAVIVIGYLVLLLAMRFAYTAPDAASDAQPTCRGEVMATDATCTETRRVFVQRTGRISWYTDEEVTLTYDQKAAQQDEDRKLVTWFWGMATGTVGLVVVFLGTALLLRDRPRRDAVYLGSATLGPLLAAVAFVGWAETRFAPGQRPGVFLWREQDGTASAIVMLGLVAYGTWATLQGARLAPDPDVPVEGAGVAAGGSASTRAAGWSPAPARDPTFAGYPLAGWWERALARGIDFVILWVILLIISIVVAIVTFVAGRPLLGEETAGRVMQVSLPVLAFLIAVGYDTQIVDPEKAKNAEGNTIGKRVIGLRVLPREPAVPGGRYVTEGAAWLRGFVWWGPIFLAVFAATGFGIVSPIPYGFALFALPLLNVTGPLVDRRLRQSFADRFAKTVVVRAR